MSLPVRELDPDFSGPAVREPKVSAPVPLVLVGHGSRDPRSSATLRALAEQVGRHWAGPVTAAFLDFDPPSVILG